MKGALRVRHEELYLLWGVVSLPKGAAWQEGVCLVPRTESNQGVRQGCRPHAGPEACARSGPLSRERQGATGKLKAP